MSRFFKLALIVAGAATLAACGQSPLRNQHSDLRSSTTTRQATFEQPRRQVASVVRRTPAPEASTTQGKSQGIASFYSQGTRTASAPPPASTSTCR